jgi:hypothetical protein
MTLRNVPQDDERDQAFINDVIKHGHMVMAVEPTVDDPFDEPAFSYSVGGFEAYGAPEILISGLRPELRHSMINYFMECWEKGDRLACGVRYSGFIEGFDIVCLNASKSALRTHATFADWYHERKPFPLWQMIWPGAVAGEFPWDVAEDSELLDLQENLTAHPWASWKIVDGVVTADRRTGMRGMVARLFGRQ